MFFSAFVKFASYIHLQNIFTCGRNTFMDFSLSFLKFTIMNPLYFSTSAYYFAKYNFIE